MSWNTAQKYTLPNRADFGTIPDGAFTLNSIMTPQGVMHFLECRISKGTYTRQEINGEVKYWIDENPEAAPYLMDTRHPMVRILDQQWNKGK